MEVQKKPPKNTDIQLLRAAAITAVLGFHLRPESVPQGFLGVDIFFVISGYLMTVILYEKTFTFQTCLRFYERRLKRLLPAYILTIFATLAVTSAFLIKIDYDFLRADAIWSMLFATNFQSMFNKDTYFALISDYKFLLHTWSLSVEIQYYLIAPLILIPISWSSTPLMSLITISGFSWAFQTFIPFPTVSFGLVFSRIWQFLIGSVAFYALKIESQKPPEKIMLISGGGGDEDEAECEDLQNPSSPLKCISYDILRSVNFGAILFICFVPKLFEDHRIYESLIRLISTMLGGAAIYLGAKESLSSESSSSCSFFIKIGIYLGNISYSVYLVHYPVIILAKYLIIFEATPLWKFILIIFVFAIAQYHLFEKPLLHQSTIITFVIGGIITGLTIFILCQPQAFGFIKVTTQPAAEANEKISLNCPLTNTDCNWDPELTAITPKILRFGSFLCSYNGTGKATVLVAGNSFAGQQFAGIKKALSSRYKKIYLVTHPGCLVFESLNVGDDERFQCNTFFNKTAQFLEKLKPEIFVISQATVNYAPFHIALNSTEAYFDDTITKEVAGYFRLFSTLTQKIMVIEPHPIFSYNVPLTIAKEIALGKHISLRNLPLDRSSIDPSWLRIQAAMRECPSCSAIDINNAFIENGRYSVYDSKTKLSFFCDNWHFSPHGVERMVPTLRKALAQTLDELNL